jgi:hypothetical protein
MKKIVVIGDSHSQLFANNPNFKRGLWMDSMLEEMFDVRWMGPVTYWRLCRDQSEFINFSRNISYTPYHDMTITTFCEPEQSVVLVLGEIDVRSNILKHNPTNYKEGADYMLDRISCFVEREKSRVRLNLMSIIPPIKINDCQSVNPEFPFIGSDYDRSELTKYMNRGLKMISDNHNIGYFDIYSLYSDDMGFLKPDLSDNIVHAIKSESLEIYIKKYFDQHN